MTQQVILEDGSVHEFLDDASQDEMLEALPQQQYQGVLREPAIAASGATKGFIGMTSIPGDIGEFYDKNIGQPFAKAVTGQTPSFGLKDILGGTGQENIARAQQAGFVNNPSLQPQDEGERLVEAGGAGLGGNLPIAALTGGAGIIPQSVSAAGAGVGAKGVEDLWPDNWPGKQTVAPFIGGLIGGKVGASGADLAAKGINAFKGGASPIVQAYDKLGIKPRLAGDITGDRNLQILQATGAEMPLGAQMVKSASEKTLDEFGHAVEKTASKLGNSVTLQEAGSALQDEGKNWLNQFKLSSQKNWNAVDAAIGKSTPVPLSNTKQAIANITAPAQGNPAIASFLKSPLAKQFITILRTSPNGQVPWQTARALKTRLGEYLENPELVSDAGGAQAKMLYGALSNDMKLSITDPNSLAIFNHANAATSAGHDFIENYLSNISGKGILPEQAATYALNSGVRGGTTLQALRQQMPKGVDELAAASIRRAGMAQPGAQNATGSAISPNSWLNTYDPTRRMAPEAYGALFPNPDVQSRMGALDTVADSMRKSSEFASKSHSALPATTTLALSAPLVAGAHGLAEGGIGHGIRDFMLGSLPLAVGTGAGALTTNPAITRLLSTPGASVPFGWNPSIMSGAYGGSR